MMLEPQPINPIFAIEVQIKERYPGMNGITAWKDSKAVWIYHFDSIPYNQQAEVLDYARSLDPSIP